MSGICFDTVCMHKHIYNTWKNWGTAYPPSSRPTTSLNLLSNQSYKSVSDETGKLQPLKQSKIQKQHTCWKEQAYRCMLRELSTFQAYRHFRARNKIPYDCVLLYLGTLHIGPTPFASVPKLCTWFFVSPEVG